jgi:parallel beta-helix repeat protein
MKRYTSLALTALFCAGGAQGRDISGAITSQLTLTEDSQLIGDVTCSTGGVACIVVGAPSVTLKLNGFTMTGEADPETACGGPITADGSTAISVSAQTNVSIEGPGVIQRFRGFGIVIGADSARVKVTGVTVSTNCRSGIFISGASDNELTGNVAIRNGHPVNPCGGI